ncbi:13223_t:CDS:2 [Funneliformis geosporum]|uniref:2510_t:CDS:1 n=1 Tax=Funneliformis geosporum TaxID=1117311 RepID=A0A9W4SQY4_9GLOM|nr:2510_t:CDS:2 [Funneliformis geosporum]CAI2180454.1 13223_t:CDS:2 [Funneliformis geosporum]
MFSTQNFTQFHSYTDNHNIFHLTQNVQNVYIYVNPDEIYKQSTFNQNNKDIYAHSVKQEYCCQKIEEFQEINGNPSESERSQSCKEANISKKNKAPPCKWKEEATKYLLDYLKANKEKVLRLESRGSIAGEVRLDLWNGASAKLHENNHIYAADQCAIKWKNIKQNYNNNSKFRYKSEVKEILSKNRSKLAPKISNEKPCHNKRKMSSELSETDVDIIKILKYE